jgi:hypothetical protein
VGSTISWRKDCAIVRILTRTKVRAKQLCSSPMEAIPIVDVRRRPELNLAH